ncbi:MAG TPA: AAA family ATPase, partial [Lentzea sp.]
MEVPILGRDRELAELRAALVAATGRLVLIGGDAGIGKTRLATAVLAMAAEYDIPVARGQAVDDPGMPPLWPWRRVARDVPALERVLAGSHFDPADATSRFALVADATDALIAAAAGRGLLIVLEDVHWVDQTSLRLLTHLAGELGAARVVVIATYRADPPPALLRSPAAQVLRLGGLTREDVAGWVRRVTTVEDPDALAARLIRDTGGNPLYVRMLLDRITASGEITVHPELHKLVLSGLDGMSAEARDVLGAASVLGERIEPALLAAVTGVPDLGPLLDEAVAARVVDAGSMAFAHALVRDAIYEDLPPSTRSDLHRRCAEALIEAGGAPGRIATHWSRAGDAVSCTRWATAAAHAATADLAYDDAVRFAALALSSSSGDRAALTLDLARAEFLCGEVDSSLDHCRTASRLAQDEGDADLMAEAALVITGLGGPDLLTAVDHLCVLALQHSPSDVLRSRLLARRAMAATVTGACTLARSLSATALELATALGDPDAELDGIHARH